MNLYEYLPHEYSYALFLADHYDLYPYDSMIHNMVSEQYRRDEDDDASAHNSETDEDAESGSVIQKLANSSSEFVFGSFNNPIKPVSNLSIKPEFDGFSIKVGEISCPLMDSCCNIIDDDESAFIASEDDKIESLDTAFVSSATIQKIKNWFVVPEVFFAKLEDFIINTLPVRLCGSVYGVSAVRSFTSWLFVGKRTESIVSSDNNQILFFKIHDESIVAFDPGGGASSISPFTASKFCCNSRLWWIPWDRGRKTFDIGINRRRLLSIISPEATRGPVLAITESLDGGTTIFLTFKISKEYR